MNYKPYSPHPIDTTDVELPDEMKQLIEQLAHNVHENWALGRLNDGWTFGPVRNDAVETLKLIMKLGWTIEKKQP